MTASVQPGCAQRVGRASEPLVLARPLASRGYPAAPRRHVPATVVRPGDETTASDGWESGALMVRLLTTRARAVDGVPASVHDLAAGCLAGNVRRSWLQRWSEPSSPSAMPRRGRRSRRYPRSGERSLVPGRLTNCPWARTRPASRAAAVHTPSIEETRSDGGQSGQGLGRMRGWRGFARQLTNRDVRPGAWFVDWLGRALA